MSSWAEIDDNNIVLRVLVGDNNDPTGDEGYQWLIDNLGGSWIKASYNSKIRFNYPAIGDIYDPIADAFHAPDPECHDERILDVSTYRWTCTNLEHNVKFEF